MTIYDFGTIVLVNFPQTDLKKGPKRPALVIYDEGDEDVILARITSQPHAGKQFRIGNRRGFLCLPG